MAQRKEKNNNWLLFVAGSFSILLGISLILFDVLSNKQIDDLEEQAITDFYIAEENKQSEDTVEEVKKEIPKEIKYDYIAIIKIPKINLERGLVDLKSKYNNVNYNIEILKESSKPDEENGNVILAAHSGNSRVSFFKNLNKLVLGDEVFIDYNGKTYSYKVTNIYDIEKTGKAKIVTNKNKTSLTLITCRHNTNKQIVIICEQV